MTVASVKATLEKKAYPKQIGNKVQYTFNHIAFQIVNLTLVVIVGGISRQYIPIPSITDMCWVDEVLYITIIDTVLSYYI